MTSIFLSTEKRERSNACAQTQQCDHGIDAVGEKQSKSCAKFTPAFGVTCTSENFDMPSFDIPCNLAHVKTISTMAFLMIEPNF